MGQNTAMLTPFDDFPIHPSADPIAHPATADPNHYDRYWFNGAAKDGSFFIGGAMGHYPVRGVIDAAFSVVRDGVEYSLFTSGIMPLDRRTAVGPLAVEVIEPMRTIRLTADRSAKGLGCDLIFRARTVAIEEPRQRIVAPDGVLVMDHTRLTQWGTWEGTIWIDDEVIEVDPATTVATRDRSWGVRPVGQQLVTQRPGRVPQVFWHWLPLHFDDFCTHMALHEHKSGERWLEAAMTLPLLGENEPACGHDPATHLTGLTYDIEWEPGRREMRSAVFTANRPDGSEVKIELEKLYTFRMRGIGYTHPHWSHGSNHGELEIGREDIRLEDFDPLDISSIHLQNIVRARLDGQVGYGVLEQFVLGEHDPTGMRGFTDGWAAAK
jgi:hypothetical protein